jgi:hypothetical protein
MFNVCIQNSKFQDKFPIWNSRADEKRREIQMVKVFKWYPVIDMFDTLQVNWVMEIN